MEIDLSPELKKLNSIDEFPAILFNTMNDGVLLVNAKGKIFECNKAFHERLGYQKEELIGMSVAELDPPEYASKVHERIAQIKRDGKAVFETAHYRRDGSIMPVELSASTISIADELYFFSIVRDLSERKRLDKVLDEKEAMYRALVETSADGFWAADNQGRFIEVNEAYLKRSGYSREEFLTKGIPDIEAIESPEDTQERIAHIIREGHARFESKHITKAGEEWPVEIVTTFFPLNGGVFLAYCIDISERKTVQESIERQQKELNKLSQAIAQANEAVIITDKHGIIEYVNPAFTKMTGYSEQEAIGQSTAMLKSEAQEAAVYQKLWGDILNGKVWQGSLVDRHKNGSFYPTMISISPVFNDAGDISHFVSIQKDMTELKAMERQLLHAQKMESIGTLVGGIAHDFNNMLAAVQGHIYMASRQLNHPAELSKRLKMIEQLSEDAALVVKQLLTFAKEDIVEMEVISLNHLVEEGFKLARSIIPENITHHLAICQEALFVEADMTQLQQAMINLSNNARDAVQAMDYPEISWHLSKYVADSSFHQRHPDIKAEEFACIAVKDNGSGIKEKHIKAIFDPFFTTKATGKGTGLGLAMVFGSVDRHGGVLEVESQEGKGTSFYIYLPLASQYAQPKSIAAIEISQGERKTILLVEDDSDIREVTAESLRMDGFVVLEACNGVEAKALYLSRPHEISLILTDVVMPEKGGVQLAKEIRQLNFHVPIILTTGYDKEHVVSQHNIDNCIILNKPLAYHKLNQAISKIIVGSKESALI